jgi:hypothetical protein
LRSFEILVPSVKTSETWFCTTEGCANWPWFTITDLPIVVCSGECSEKEETMC